MSSVQKLAVIGDPIAHSLSPVLHNFLIRHFALPFTYEALHLPQADLPQMMRSRLAGGAGEFRGINVTIPHKQAVLPFLDTLDETAAAIGAVNTIVVDNGKLIGYNTDAAGFRRSLEMAKVSISGKAVLVLGAGGAARAVVFALLQAGARTIYLCNRSTPRAEALLADFAINAGAGQLQHLPWVERISWLEKNAVALIINTTSVGMHSQNRASLLPPHIFTPDMSVVDLVYNPLHTEFLQGAGAAGATVVNGLGMLIHQGVAALELWSNKPLDIRDIYSALENQLQNALK
jgi:shikimate dehydrogenase